MKKNFSLLQKVSLIGLLLTLNIQFSWSQSDNCAGAPALSVGSSCTNTAYNILTAWVVQAGLPAPSCVGVTNYRDGFFSFTATSTTTTVSMNDDATGGPNATLMVLSGACGSLTQMGCSENGNGVLETITVTTVVGQVYYIAIVRSNNNNPNDMTGTICVTSGAAAPGLTMINGSASTCTATFLDPGGTGNYSNSQDFTMTICPSTTGAKLRMDFTSFATESCCELPS